MGATLMTAEELLHTNIPHKLVELVRGRLIVREPPGYLHGDVTMRLSILLGFYAHERGLGRVLAAETGFKLQSDPDTVRAADIAFISRERVPPSDPDRLATRRSRRISRWRSYRHATAPARP
jgi:Uma2 family endonuclease